MLRRVVQARRLTPHVAPVHAPWDGRRREVASCARAHGELAGDAAVLIGRCLPYGEGITYWPLREIVRSLEHALPELDAAEAEILRAAVGDGDAAAGPEETARAFRRLVAIEARRRPVVLGFEDIHWAEPALSS